MWITEARSTWNVCLYESWLIYMTLKIRDIYSKLFWWKIWNSGHIFSKQCFVFTERTWYVYIHTHVFICIYIYIFVFFVEIRFNATVGPLPHLFWSAFCLNVLVCIVYYIIFPTPWMTVFIPFVYIYVFIYIYTQYIYVWRYICTFSYFGGFLITWKSFLFDCLWCVQLSCTIQ